LAAKEPMIAVDTNVLVRFLVTGDDPDQSAWAKALFASDRTAVAHTVLLETEWVLRESFRFSRAQIAEAFVRLLGLRTVVCAGGEAVLRAIRAFEAGFDFADALHAMTSEAGVTEFVTFDREFAKRAQARGLVPRVRLLASK
jgi:predicted nucleic-acid-binding protein